MALDGKSADSQLYFCANIECRVVMFKPEKGQPVCPWCRETQSLLVREPVATRLGIVRR